MCCRHTIHRMSCAKSDVCVRLASATPVAARASTVTLTNSTRARSIFSTSSSYGTPPTRSLWVATVSCFATDGQVDTPTSELFLYSERFVRDYLPDTIELGRSFVQPDYQPTKNLSKGLYSLDNLWDGLGSLIDIYPEAKYYFGKVTMYPQLERTARDMILYFIQKHFPDKDDLVTVRPELDLPILTDSEWLASLFCSDNYRDDYKTLVKLVRERGAAVPPLVNAYMNLSSTLRSFGTALNPGFGKVEETGILVTIADIYEEKVNRHMIYDKNEIPYHLK